MKVAEQFAWVCMGLALLVFSITGGVAIVMMGVAEIDAANSPARCIEMVTGMSGDSIEGSSHGEEL